MYRMKPKTVPTRMSSTEDVDRLRQWAKDTNEEIQGILVSMAPLQGRLNEARERLDLISRLLGLAERSVQQTRSVPSAPASRASEDPPPELTPSRVRTGTDVEAEIERILAEAGKPVHIGDIRRALIERGVPLPGRGDEANIILRLRRDQGRFSRTGRGTYALTEWGIPSVPAGRVVKRTVRRKARST
jgi:hypothetical protein